MHRFRWRVSAGHEVLAYISGVKLRDFYMDPRACAHAFREGRRKLKGIFGEDLRLPRISVPALSYGHISCLGAEIVFPADTAPVPQPVYSSIEEGIRSLCKKRDFSECRLFKHYLRVYRYLKSEFPEENVSLYGFGYEGPITSALLLRGPGFLTDIYR
ncbi:hypothetical protein DRO58_04655, partial [Candidatus Bathyarchaeota archaeon]